jgi:hypothetical protein
MNANIYKSTLLQGLIMGLGFCLYTTFMWLTQLDTTHLNIGQYLDMLIVFWPITVIFWAIRQENQKQALSVITRIGIALWIGLLSYLIYEPYLYTYHNFINPDWFSYVLDLKEAELKAAHTATEKITETLQQMIEANVQQNGIFKLSTFIPSVVVLPTLIALVTLVFIKKKNTD